MTAGQLADDLHALGEYEKAYDLRKDALAEAERVFGLGDWGMVYSLTEGLASDLRKMGKEDLAEKAMDRFSGT
jgi:hypothetical protein